MIENHVIKLELAKKLKDLGIKQDSFFYWEKCPMRDYEFVISSSDWHDMWTHEWGDCHRLGQQEIYSAFMMTELLDILPSLIKSNSSISILLEDSYIKQTDDRYAEISEINTIRTPIVYSGTRPGGYYFLGSNYGPAINRFAEYIILTLECMNNE